MRFYLGAHHPHWLGVTSVPLFVSERALVRRKSPPRAAGMWALDSGGFSQLFQYAGWPAGSDRVYVEHVQRYRDEIGNLEWAAPQDWMCEPFMLEKTGLTVAGHQDRTVGNYLELRAMDDTLPFVPVLQGYTQDDYLRCVGKYQAAGVPLVGRVGVGTVCRRQGTLEAERIVRAVHAALPGAQLHVFGAKISGLPLYADCIGSADSMAWSYDARRRPPLPGHELRHKSCANCPDYALRWREKVLRSCATVQVPLWESVA